MSALGRSEVLRVIQAPPATVYRAFIEPAALVTWLPPGDMRGEVHAFDPREGGAFSMTLHYLETNEPTRGKTTDDSDSFQGRFVTLIPNERIVWAVEFQSSDPAFAGEMLVITSLSPEGEGTRVTMRSEQIPPGILPEDNETGTRVSLEQLAAFLES